MWPPYFPNPLSPPAKPEPPTVVLGRCTTCGQLTERRCGSMWCAKFVLSEAGLPEGSRGITLNQPRPPRISSAERERRKPLPVDVLVGAQQDAVHVEQPSRLIRSVPVRKRGP